MKKFYDTNILLNHIDNIVKDEEVFFISSITLQELEHIKISRNKDEDVKFKARQVTRFLQDNESKYECIIAKSKHYSILEQLGLAVDNDNLIMACAFEMNDLYDNELIFFTDDMCCYNIGKHIFRLECQSLKNDDSNNFKGYKEVIMSDEELASFYEKENKGNLFDLITNEYIVIKNSLNQPVDAWKFNGEETVRVENKTIKSNTLGKMKPKDFYQLCALDSFQNNQITVIKGKAGSGKSFLSMNFLFNQLEKDKIDKIIIFINDIPVRGTNLHGFLPGDLKDKLLESNTGNFLMGKLGDKITVEHLISMGKLILLPMSDIRGFDTNGMNCAVYITEAQNMNIDIMKLCLQRIGEDCICIIDGDCDAQVDNKLFEGKNNGMRKLSEVFKGEDIYGEIELNNIYRSRIANLAERM